MPATGDVNICTAGASYIDISHTGFAFDYFLQRNKEKEDHELRGGNLVPVC
jgi:hypothetical protein